MPRPFSSQAQTAKFATIRPIVTSGNARVGTLSRRGITRRFLPDHERHKRFLGMEAVLRLVPDGALRAIENVLGDLLAVMGGQTMEDDRVAARVGYERRIDAEAAEIAEPTLAVLFLPHARPDVRVEDVGAACSSLRIVRELHVAPFSSCDLDGLRIGLVAGRRRRD